MSSVQANQRKDDQDTQGFKIADLWRPIRKYWFTVIALATIVTVAVVFYVRRQTKIYEAEATVQFDPSPPRPLGSKVDSVVELGSGAVWDTREYYETEYQILQSRKIALEVVKNEGLSHDYCFLSNLPANCSVPSTFADAEDDDAADTLRARLRVDAVHQSRIAAVHLQDADPERAARVLNQLVQVFKDSNVSTVADSADNAQKHLRVKHDMLKSELDESELALHRYKEQKNLLSVEFDDKSNMLREQIGQLNTTLTTIGTRRDEIAARYAELSTVPSNNPSELPASELLSSSLLTELRGSYVNALRDRDALIKGGKGQNHPDVQAADAKVEVCKEALLGEVRNIQGALKRDLATVNREEGSAAGRFEKAKKDALELNLLEIEYSQLRRKKENTEKLYALLLERSTENDLSREFLMNNISIVDSAAIPKAPVKPNVPATAAAGALAGLLLGIGAALGRGRLDRTVKTPEDVEAVIPGTFLGLIPEIDANELNLARKRGRSRPETGRELYIHHNPMSSIAEASRSVRTNLLFTTPDKPYRVLLVTSPGPNEGKTTVACCIAIAMAQANRRVLLVDCDLRRSRLHRIFGVSSKDGLGGLTNALLDDTIEDPSFATEVPNLSVVPAGPTPPNPSELLQSERFKSFLSRMKNRYDLVILDSPPVVAVTDAAILSTLVDGTVFVVRAFKTGKDLAQHAGRVVGDVGGRIAGIVLNAVNLQKDEYKYSYQYYRRGDYYTTTGDRPQVNQSIRETPKAPSPRPPTSPLS